MHFWYIKLCEAIQHAEIFMKNCVFLNYVHSMGGYNKKNTEQGYLLFYNLLNFNFFKKKNTKNILGTN